MKISNPTLAVRIEEAIADASAKIAKRQLSADDWDDEEVAKLAIAHIIRDAIRDC